MCPPFWSTTTTHCKRRFHYPMLCSYEAPWSAALRHCGTIASARWASGHSTIACFNCINFNWPVKLPATVDWLLHGPKWRDPSDLNPSCWGHIITCLAQSYDWRHSHSLRRYAMVSRIGLRWRSPAFTRGALWCNYAFNKIKLSSYNLLLYVVYRSRCQNRKILWMH